jgi:hypothetical protein
VPSRDLPVVLAEVEVRVSYIVLKVVETERGE